MAFSSLVGYSTQDVYYEWRFGNDKAVEIEVGMALSQFDLIAHPAANTTEPFKGGKCKHLKYNNGIVSDGKKLPSNAIAGPYKFHTMQLATIGSRNSMTLL